MLWTKVKTSSLLSWSIPTHWHSCYLLRCKHRLCCSPPFTDWIKLSPFLFMTWENWLLVDKRTILVLSFPILLPFVFCLIALLRLVYKNLPPLHCLKILGVTYRKRNVDYMSFLLSNPIRAFEQTSAFLVYTGFWSLIESCILVPWLCFHPESLISRWNINDDECITITPLLLFCRVIYWTPDLLL